MRAVSYSLAREGKWDRLEDLCFSSGGYWQLDTLLSKSDLTAWLFPNEREKIVNAWDKVKRVRSPASVVREVVINFPLATQTSFSDEEFGEYSPFGEFASIAVGFSGALTEFITYLQELREKVRTLSEAAPDERDRSVVYLGTYFRAKGRQWHSVFLPGMNAGVFPASDAIETERRLCYVAMTRATSNLYVSYVRRIAEKAAEPSLFISEAGLPQAIGRNRSQPKPRSS